MKLLVLAVLGLISVGVRAGGPYGQAKKPPLGWRSWNCFGSLVDQKLILDVMDAVTDRSRTVNGKPMSLADVGYADVGLDDNWQACGKGVNNSFHDAEGKPLVNELTFPNISVLPAYAHSKNLTASFYMNNCICRETQFTDPIYIQKVYERSVDFLVSQKWDGVKLDGCSQFHNTTLWAQLINATGRPMAIENCHNTANPTRVELEPYNWYRSSNDIRAEWSSIFSNLQSVVQYQDWNTPLSRPGCWAYPDMLEVGNLLNVVEDRSHFGAWCITSSPLILGFDVLDKKKVDAVWEIITNTEAIAVNQNYAGHPGLLLRQYHPDPLPFNVVQLWTKPQPNGAMAAFFLSNQDAFAKNSTFTVTFAELNITTTAASVRDIWQHKDLGMFQRQFTTDSFGGHDSRFYLITPHN